ncbi:hypothetical protein Btru_073831 [Bulinus truncatus]|nr:hypothetical protein Btru_073831 [Bulinus truncatus]
MVHLGDGTEGVGQFYPRIVDHDPKTCATNESTVVVVTSLTFVTYMVVQHKEITGFYMDVAVKFKATLTDSKVLPETPCRLVQVYVDRTLSEFYCLEPVLATEIVLTGSVVGLVCEVRVSLAWRTVTISSEHKTSCSKGLIKDTDRLIFVGEIPSYYRPEVYFDIKQDGDDSIFETRCILSTYYCMQDYPTCYCYKPKQSNILKYVFNITADVKDSNGTFEVYFIDSTVKAVKSTLNIPEIIDPAITSLKYVTINGEEVKNECNKHYKYGDLSLHAACKDHLLPCTLELFVNGERKKQGSEIIFESKYEISSEVKLTIKQNICNNEQLTSDLNCVLRFWNSINNLLEVSEQTKSIIRYNSSRDEAQATIEHKDTNEDINRTVLNVSIINVDDAESILSNQVINFYSYDTNSAERNDKVFEVMDKCKEPKDTSSKECKEPKDTSSKECKEPKDTSSKECKEPKDTSSKECKEPMDTSSKECKEPMDTSSKECKEPMDTSSKECKEPKDTSSKECKEPKDTSSKECKEPMETSPKECVNTLTGNSKTYVIN